MQDEAIDRWLWRLDQVKGNLRQFLPAHPIRVTFLFSSQSGLSPEHKGTDVHAELFPTDVVFLALAGQHVDGGEIPSADGESHGHWFTIGDAGQISPTVLCLKYERSLGYMDSPPHGEVTSDFGFSRFLGLAGDGPADRAELIKLKHRWGLVSGYHQLTDVLEDLLAQAPLVLATRIGDLLKWGWDAVLLYLSARNIHPMLRVKVSPVREDAGDPFRKYYRGMYRMMLIPDLDGATGYALEAIRRVVEEACADDGGRRESEPPGAEPVAIAENTHERWRHLKEWVTEECVHNGAMIGDVLREADNLELASVLDSLVVEARQVWDKAAPLWEDVATGDEVGSKRHQRSAEACMATCGRVFRCMLEAEGWLCKNYGPKKADEVLDRAADALGSIWEIMISFPTKPIWLSTPGVSCGDVFRGLCENLHGAAADLRQIQGASGRVPALNRDEPTNSVDDQREKAIAQSVGEEIQDDDDYACSWEYLKHFAAAGAKNWGFQFGTVRRESSLDELADMLDVLVAEARHMESTLAPLWEQTPDTIFTDRTAELGVDSRDAAEKCMANWYRAIRCVEEAEQSLYRQYGPGQDTEILDRIATGIHGVDVALCCVPGWLEDTSELENERITHWETDDMGRNVRQLTTKDLLDSLPEQKQRMDRLLASAFGELHSLTTHLRSGSAPPQSGNGAVCGGSATSCESTYDYSASFSGRVWEKHTSPSCLYHFSVQEVYELFNYWYGWGSMFDEELEEFPDDDDPRLRHYCIVSIWISMLADAYGLSSKRFMDASRIHMPYALGSPYVITIPENITDMEEDDPDGPTDQERRELTDGLEVYHATLARYRLAAAEASVGVSPASGPKGGNAPGDYTVMDMIKYLETVADPLSIERMIGIGICAQEVAKSFAYFASAGGEESLPISHEFFLKHLAEWIEPFCRVPNGFAEERPWYSPRMAAAVGKLAELVPSLLHASKQNTGRITPVDEGIVRGLRQAAVALNTEMRPGKPDAESSVTNIDAMELPIVGNGMTLKAQREDLQGAGEKAVTAETPPKAGAGKPKLVSERLALAFKSYEWVCSIHPHLVPDDRARYTKQMHEKVKEECPVYASASTPCFETWKRYIREYERITAGPINTPTAGRAYGKSIVTPDQI